MTPESLCKLEETLGHKFTDRTLLVTALTHSSTGALANYERLEFLGDRVLGLVMAQHLYDLFPGEAEGDMAKRHAALVQGSMLSGIARRAGLGVVLQFSEAERAAGGAENENILADALESLIGALYLDAGLEICRRIIIDLWGDAVHTMQSPPQDPKTALQEWAQARGLPLPLYELAAREGPDHAPLFEIRVTVNGHPPMSSKGPSRRVAEKEAARNLLEYLSGLPS